MKIIKKILFVIVGIIVLALVVALFVSKEYSVKREITINNQVATHGYTPVQKPPKSNNNSASWSVPAGCRRSGC